jgi:hypothetical protein
LKKCPGDARAGLGPSSVPHPHLATSETDRVVGSRSPSPRPPRDLTPGRLRELAELSDGEGITHESAEDLFAAAIVDFQRCLDDLYDAAKKVGEITNQMAWPWWTRWGSRTRR